MVDYPPVEAHFFGAFDILVHGQTVGALRSRRIALLFLLLLRSRGSELQRSYLAGQVWPESSEFQALGSLRQSLMDLRRALGTEAGRIITSDRRSIRFVSDDIVSDVLIFDTNEKSSNPENWKKAVEAYQGSLLPGLSESQVQLERESYERRFLRLLERLLSKALAETDWNEIASHCIRILQIDPTHEGAASELIRERVERADTAGVVRIYQETRGALRRHLGIPPSSHLTKVYEDALKRLATAPPEPKENSQAGSKLRKIGSEEWAARTEEERLVMRRMALFPESFSMAEVQSMCSNSGLNHAELSELIHRLIDDQIVSMSVGISPSLYSLEETARQLAFAECEQLSEVEETTRNYLECIAAFVETGYSAFSGPGQRHWLWRFEGRQATLLDALQRAVEFAATATYAYRIAGSVWGFFVLQQGPGSILELVTAAASRTDGPPRQRVAALNAAGFLVQSSAKPELSRSYHNEALRIAVELGDEELVALTQSRLAIVHRDMGEVQTAKSLFKEAQETFIRLGDEWWYASTILSLAEFDWRQGKAANAESELLKALAMYQRLEDDLQIAATRSSLAAYFLQQGLLEEARAHQTIAHSKLHGLPGKSRQIYSLIQLAEIEILAEDYRTADAYALESFRLAEEIRLRQAVFSAVRFQILVALRQHRVSDSIRLLKEFLPEVVGTGQMLLISSYLELLALAMVRLSQFDLSRAILARVWELRRSADPELLTYPRSILRVLHELRHHGGPDALDAITPLTLAEILAILSDLD